MEAHRPVVLAIPLAGGDVRRRRHDDPGANPRERAASDAGRFREPPAASVRVFESRVVQIMTSLALSRAYLHCDLIASAEAGNFYWAFRFLPQPRRNGMLAVYAFARQADDLADLGADTGTAAAGVGDAGTWGARGADPPDRLPDDPPPPPGPRRGP